MTEEENQIVMEAVEMPPTPPPSPPPLKRQDATVEKEELTSIESGKPKRERTQKQIEAFERCRQARQEKLILKKKEKEVLKLKKKQERKNKKVVKVKNEPNQPKFIQPMKN